MKKILIVDDDVKIISYLKDDLTNTYHFDVNWLTEAGNVMETLNGAQFDAIILDIMMPVPSFWTDDETRRAECGLRTGIVLFEKIRSQFPFIPIIIYTAKAPTLEDLYTIYIRKI